MIEADAVREARQDKNSCTFVGLHGAKYLIPPRDTSLHVSNWQQLAALSSTFVLALSPAIACFLNSYAVMNCTQKASKPMPREKNY